MELYLSLNPPPLYLAWPDHEHLIKKIPAVPSCQQFKKKIRATDWPGFRTVKGVEEKHGAGIHAGGAAGTKGNQV